jgi:hypothetical protein
MGCVEPAVNRTVLQSVTAVTANYTVMITDAMWL